MLTRRFFVKGSAVVMAGAGAVPGWLGRAAAATQGKRKTLVAIFQRGAADGLNIVAPFGDKRYADLRPTIGVRAPDKNQPPQQTAIDLDGFFGLHPQLDMLKPLWEKQQLAIVHAAGSPDPSRSHFDAQDFMESGTPGQKGNGWLNRALTAPTAESSPLRAIAMGSQLPRTLRGDREAIAIGDMLQYRMDDDTQAILESMYETSTDSQVGAAGKDAFSALKTLDSLFRDRFTPRNPAQFGGSELGRSLQQVARLIKADVGVEAAFAEIGGWDHHQNEQQQLPQVLRQFGTALSAFCQEMGDRMEDIVLVTMSEFGRTAQENGDNGTDHGHGSVMMVLGGPVAGGKMYGRWPGLEKEQLFEGRDLDVTTDFRAVLGELVSGHLGQKDIAQVFPGYKAGAPLGLLRA